ncbi:MAG: isopenicillin N synthase family oxygenase [Acidimicrobiales bacterium]|nr:isopenicillin N synthase family oxygenase [Acidimicrobiales bacterium]
MSTRTVPVIDLSGYLARSPGAEAIAVAEVRDALERVGFFSIVGHGVDWAEVEAIYGLAARYHRLPEEAKLAHAMSATSMGYVALGGARRPGRPHALNAAFFMGRPGSKRNRFPDEAHLPGFEAQVSAYYRRLEGLCTQLLPLYAQAADMPADHFDRFFDPALATLRLTHYPPLDAEEDQWGIDPHSDAGFMTLLPSNPVAGLQIRPEGADWFPVDQEPRSFVVNAGDTLRRWSNDRFRSTMHRAVNAAGIDRYAIPFFFDPRVDTVIECLAGCGEAGRAPRHEPIVYRDYLRAFMGEGYSQLALGVSDRGV